MKEFKNYLQQLISEANNTFDEQPSKVELLDFVEDYLNDNPLTKQQQHQAWELYQYDAIDDAPIQEIVESIEGSLEFDEE